ncbi:TPA: S1 RNA-binding domain-containing protein [Candidatus Poribacteria bacterium]|nr:S1 RNA-binding domain-containing protein [Candidatus Poribacteria bacterium]
MQPEHFQTANQIAQELVRSETDPNETAKVLHYLAAHQGGGQLFTFLRTVIWDGMAVVRSGRTIDYYRSILRICEKYLKPYQNNPKQMAEILGWAVRLMRYHLVPSRRTKLPHVGVKPTAHRVKKEPRTIEEEKPTSTQPSIAVGTQPQHLADLRPGMILQGTVKNIRPFGVFVDIGVGRDGLVHVSELAHGYVRDPSELVSEGDNVNVKVLRVDTKRNRINLSMKNVPQQVEDAEGSTTENIQETPDRSGMTAMEAALRAAVEKRSNR